MKKTIVMAAIFLMVSSVFCINAGQTKPISVGVKVGDWIEYTVSTTGTPVVGHDLKYAKMEIVQVIDTQIWANVVAETPDGTWSSSIRTFDLAEGNVQAWVIIPANLSPGDSFYDAFLNSTITIQGEITMTVAGATRTITYLDTPERYKEWDKATGMFIVTKDYLSNYTVTASVTATNLWAPQILGIDQPIFYTLIAILIVVIIAIAAVLAIRFGRKR
jgi:hypothetical protein